MKHRSRLLRVAKWGGVVVTLLGGIVIVVSAWFWIYFRATPRLTVTITNGGALLYYSALPLSSATQGGSRFSFGRSPFPASFSFLPYFENSDFTITIDGQTTSTPFATYVTIPLWMPWLFAILATTLFIRLDRRPLRGHCPCGYDLTGNESGTCPECGREASRCV